MRLETETTVFKKDSVKDAIKNKVVHGANPTGDFQVGDTWFNPNEGYKMYSWNGTGWSPEQLDTDAIKAGAIKAGNIDAGAITADKIAANSITVDKLVVGDMSNLATVNEWDDSSMVTSPSSMATDTMVINQTSGQKGVIKKTATNQYLPLAQPKLPNIFSAGDELYYSIMLRAGSTARNVRLAVYAYDKDGNLIGRNASDSIALTTTMTKYTGSISIFNDTTWTSGKTWAAAQTYSLLIADTQVSGTYEQIRMMKATVQRKNSGDLIVGGTIEGSRIRTPVGDSYEMAHVSNKPAGTIYVDEFIPIPSGANDSYMQMMQSGVESVDSSLNVRSQMAPIKLKLYNTDESPSHLTGTEYGWYLGKVAYAERVFTEKGEVATIDPNNENAIVNATPYTFTPSNGSAWSTLGGCWFYKIGTRVHLHVAVTGLTANTNTTVYNMQYSPSGNIWSGYLPYATVVAAGRGNDGSTFASMWVASDGTVTVRSTGTNAAVDIEYDAFN